MAFGLGVLGVSGGMLRVDVGQLLGAQMMKRSSEACSAIAGFRVPVIAR